MVKLTKKMRSKRIHFTVTFYGNVDYHALFWVLKLVLSQGINFLHFFLLKKKLVGYPFHSQGGKAFPQTSAYFASLFSLLLINSKFLRKTPFYGVR